MPQASRRRFLWLAAPLALALIGVSVWAQSPQRAPILHEDLPVAQGSGSGLTFGPTPGQGQNPSAIQSSGAIIPKPDASTQPSAQDPVHGQTGTPNSAPDRSTQFSPDTQTGADGTLRYLEVFNPSVVPFKRLSSFDAVAADSSLIVSPGPLTDVPVGGTPDPDRDLFWGSLLVELSTGRDIALPSVAPAMRVLSYETKPSALALRFHSDAAGNYFVRTDEPNVQGTFRLEFLVDAPAGYFGNDLPSGIEVGDIVHASDAPVIPDLPATLRGPAARALSQLNLSASSDAGDALRTLVDYFRAFEPKAPPAPSGQGVYWDLFASQAGVCRHRAFAFMITANALGIPTHFVANEAHAFVEVWLPGIDWLRIDLGGAALQLDVQNGQGKVIHKPRQKTSLPTPPSYDNSYTQLRGQIRGLSQQQLNQAQGAGPNPLTDPDPSDPSGPSDPNDPNPTRDPGTPPGSAPNWNIPPNAAPPAGRAPTSLSIDQAADIGYRGERMRVMGKLVSSNRPVPGARVDIYLSPAGSSDDADKVRVGSLRTANDGSFSGEVAIPRGMPRRVYDVLAYMPGDSRYAPARSY